MHKWHSHCILHNEQAITLNDIFDIIKFNNPNVIQIIIRCKNVVFRIFLLLSRSIIYSMEMYFSDEDSNISTSFASTVDIIKAAAKKWKNMDINLKIE